MNPNNARFKIIKKMRRHTTKVDTVPRGIYVAELYADKPYAENVRVPRRMWRVMISGVVAVFLPPQRNEFIRRRDALKRAENYMNIRGWNISVELI